jgi:hypothetical protein
LRFARARAPGRAQAQTSLHRDARPQHGRHVSGGRWLN